MHLGRTLKTTILGNEIPIEFVKLREIAADRNKWGAVCESKGPTATKRDTGLIPTSHLG
jgi:hypothetical protein